MCKKLLFLASFVLVLGLVLASTAKADLIGWWKLDDATGSMAVDSSTYGNDGTLQGDPQWVDGVIGGALELDGDDDFVAIDGIADDLTENNFTVSAWINTTMGGDGNVIASNADGGGHDFILGVDGGNLLVEADSVRTYPPRINDDEWHFIAYVRDGSTAYAYTDGDLVGTESPSGNPAGQTRWSIGQEWDSSPSDEFNGLVDDVHFFNHPLTEGEIKGVMIGSGYPYASRPDPANGAVIEATWASLTWTPGAFAVSHDVYLGENFDDVNDGTGDTFRGNQIFNFFTVGFPGFAYPDGLVPGTTYYWRIDEVNEVDPNSPWKGEIWNFSIPTRTAHTPSPADGAQYVATDATLSWTAGFDGKLHTVYFGDDFDTVNDAAGGLPQSATTYDPGPLAKNMTYYWRVDEFDGVTTHKGNVWSFSTIIDIVITDPDLIGWWKFDEGSGDTAIDFSGHGNDGTLAGNAEWAEGFLGKAINLPGGSHVVIDGVVDDITSTNITLSAWIKSTQTGQGDIFAANDSSSGHPLEFYIDGGYPGRYDGGDTTYPTAPFVADGQWHLMTYVREGNTGYIYVDGVEAVRDAASFSLSTITRWSIGQEWDNATPSNFYTGLVDDARFYNKSLTPEEVLELTRGDPLLAWNPSPSNGAIIDVERAKQPLSWTAGDEAAEHDVYLSLDRTAVESANSSDATGIYRGQQAGTTYTPPEGLEWGTGPYYWRIDELNNDGTLTMGGTWSFTVADHLIVEDFESYTDDDLAGEAIWQSWIDGFGVADNGAQVGYLLPPYAEQGIVHGGGQSMPLMYDNTTGVRNSEAEFALTALRDWTAYDVSNLSIWFRGYPGSVGSFVEGPVGTYTMTASGRDIWDTADAFHFAYKSLNGAGSITARVVSVQNTHAWAKAGVMIRETLDPGSRNAFACVTPGNGVSSQVRVDTDNASTSDNQTGLTAPYWVKLERDVAGNFTVTHSSNGTSWSPVETAIPNRVLMSANVYIGLALTSHNAGVTCQAVFSNVTTTGAVSGQWAHQDIGISSNAAEPLYVALSNAAGGPAIVAHDDPAAATIDTWTEWIIPLQAFADQGINLTNVDKIAIGLGSKGNAAAAGGSGTMFIDDIGLYRP